MLLYTTKKEEAWLKLRIALIPPFAEGLQAIGPLSAHSADPAPAQDKPQVARVAEPFNLLDFNPRSWQLPKSIKRTTIQIFRESYRLTRVAVANG